MKTKSCCLVLLLLFAGSFVMAQKNSISPYSRYGIGTQREGRFVRNFGLAGTGYALTSDKHINPMNPASYHGLQLTSFEAALEGDNIQLQGGGQTQFQNKTYFSHLLFGLPVTDWWGMSFGMMPMTNVGYDYDVTRTLNEETGSVTNLFEGSGGLNKILFGHGFKLSDRLSIGFNSSYILGNLTYKERIIYNELGSSFHTRKTDKYVFGDFTLDFGLQHHLKLNNGMILTTGLTYAYADEVNSRRTLLIESYTGNIGFERIKDTVESALDKKTAVKLPGKYGLGFALKKEDKWILTLDMDYSDWSNVSFNQTESFSDAYSVKMAMEVKGSDTRKKSGGIKSNEMTYRFGGRYGSSYITLDGDPVKEMAASLGISLYSTSKIASQETIRGLNFGIEVGTRGKDNDIQIRENFVNIILGITINDRWFIKRKYN